MIPRFLDHFYENDNKSKSNEIILKARGINHTYFTRSRKVNVDDIAKYIIGSLKERNQKLKNLKFNQIREKDMSITNQGMSLQRLKFNPDAIKYLIDEWVKCIYADHDYERVKQIKGYFLCAIDGMDLVLPSSEEGFQFYGGTRTSKGFKTVQASSSCIYDVINRIIIDSNINPYRTSETVSAMKNITVLDELIPHDKKILIFDRGYISSKLLIDLFKMNHKFVMRISNKVFKNEISNMQSNDELITIDMTKERLNASRHEPYYTELLHVDHIVVRAIKFTLKSGIEEILLTNLEDSEFSFDEIKEIYRLRWEIETVFNALKNKIELEKFSGYKPIIIEQDFYASIYLWNMMQDMILDARGNLEEEERFHIHEMKISDSMAIGLIRNNLLKIFYNENRKDDELKNLVLEIMKHVEPVRPNRQYPRNSIKVDKTSKTFKENRSKYLKRYRTKKKQLRK